MTSEEYILKELERLGRDIDGLRGDVRNPQPPYVSQEVFELYRTEHGKRTGDLEQSVKDLKATISKINSTAWTALVFPIIVAIAVGVLLAAIR